MMNNATASLQSAVSFSVAHRTVFNHLIQSHAYIRQRNGREERLLVFLVRNIINIQNVFLVLPTGRKKKVAVHLNMSSG